VSYRTILAAGRRLSLLGGLVALLLTVAGSAPALAGTLNLQLGLDPTGCIASPWFATGMAGSNNCASSFSIFKYGPGWTIYPAVQTAGAGWTGQWQINAPAGITIDTVNLPSISSSALVGASSHGWQAGDYWAGGSSVWGPSTTSVSEGTLNNMNSSYYGFKLYCYASSCNNQGYLQVGEVDLQATENQGPGITAVGSGNLWYQGSSWVWNPAGDPWPADISAADSSGACLLWVWANSAATYEKVTSPASIPNTHTFQQCPSPNSFAQSQGAQVDTNQLVPSGTSGSFTLTLGAQNAAGVQSTPSETINADNIQPSVSLTTPNDPNPSGWAVNHAVTVDAAAHAGPSGLASLTCSVDGAAAKAYTSAGVSVNGNGKHTITCVAANQAIDPQGAHNSGSATITVDIDEQSPSLSIAPQDPNNPAQVVVNTSDSESKVASGQIEIAPQGTTNWTQIPTTFASNGQLIATIPDAGLSGPYSIQATACSQVGNCGSTSEMLKMPLRVAASSDVSFSTIVDPLVAKRVKERVRVGWHYVAVLRHGQAVKVKRGGHWKTITVIKMVERCTHKRVKVGKHRWKLSQTCKAPRVALRGTEHVQFGKPVTINGLLLSSQGVPLANTPVSIMTAPNNGMGQFTQAATVTSNAAGAWSATLPAGPSRVIQAVYAGSQTLLPATGQATVTVPARIRIKITPRTTPWGSQIRITGQVLGGYVPTNSNLLRLNVGVGRIGQIEGLPAIQPDGQFVILWKFDRGHGVIHPWFSVSTLSETAFPYTPAGSNRVVVTLGKRARHHRKHRQVITRLTGTTHAKTTTHHKHHRHHKKKAKRR